MANEPKYRVTFQPEDVVSAQRMRFFLSKKFRIVAGLWAAAAIWAAGESLLPGVVPAIPIVNSSTVLGSALLFAVVVVIFIWVAPLAEVRSNPLWKTPFQLQISDQQLMLYLEGRAKGVYVPWEQIRNVHENERVYIVYTSSEDNFLILPKAIFPDAGVEARFRRYLRTRSSLKPRDKERYEA